MTTRKRLTWADRSASPAPALPTEKGDHPAAYEDPGPHDYETYDTVSGKEEPTPPPYPHSGPPALPNEKGDHPATDPAIAAQVGKQAKQQMRAAMEQKAAKCIRLAQSMLGKTASPEAIEDQALDLMHLSERQIQASLARLGNYTLTEGKAAGEDEDEKKAGEDPAKAEEPEAKKAGEEPAKAEDEKKAGEEPDDDDDKDEEVETAGKKASRYIRLANYWIGVAKKAGEIPPAFKAQWAKNEGDEKKDEAKDEKKDEKKASDALLASVISAENAKLAADDEDEALLASMIAEENAKQAGSADDEDEALLASMLADEKKAGEEPKEDEDDKAAGEEPAEDPEAKKEASLDDDLLSLTLDPAVDDFALVDQDPMGFMDDGGLDILSDDALSALYGSHFASTKKAGEESEDEKKAGEDPAKAEEAKKEAAQRIAAKRTAAQHPKPRTASTGVRALGGTPTRVASSEVTDLSKLWETAPDVSKIFG